MHSSRPCYSTDWIKQGLTSHQTQDRSYWGRVFTDQMTQPQHDETLPKHLPPRQFKLQGLLHQHKCSYLLTYTVREAHPSASFQTRSHFHTNHATSSSYISTNTMRHPHRTFPHSPCDILIVHFHTNHATSSSYISILTM